MAREISVCHVVNSAGDASIPAEFATAQASLNEFVQVGILAWFDIKSFRNMASTDVSSLNISSRLLIDRSQYTMAKSILSEYDIIHTHHPHSGFYGKIIAKRLGIPVVQTEHNNRDGYTKKGRIASGITNILADRVACVSQSVRESFMQWESAILRDKNVSVIYNGVNMDRVESAQNVEWSIHDMVDIDSGAVVVGSAGMLTEQKAHDVLIEAVDRLNAESGQSIELVISGDGGLQEQLEAQISNADYSNRLHLLGFLERREQVYKMMSEIDIYVMPSRWEGFCVAALEAMALGTPCVLSDIPVFREVYDDAALYHSIDDPQSVAEQLFYLIEHPSKYAVYKDRGQELSDSYTLEKTVLEYTDLYKSIID